MRLFRASLCLGVLLVSGCSSVEWVNISNPRAEYTMDYNKCEMQAYNDPKFQGGMKFHVDEFRDRCLAKLGWRLREVRE